MALRVLLVDGDDHDRALAISVLGRELPAATVEEAVTAADYAAALAQGGFDVVICETELEWTDGVTLLEGIRTEAPGAAVLFFTRNESGDRAIAALKAGAHDYLVKSSRSFVALPAAVLAARQKAMAERKRLRTETRLRRLLDRSRIGTFRVTVDHELVEASAGFLRLLGVDTLEEAVELGLPELFFSRGLHGELIERLDEQGELHEQEVELRRARDGRIWVHLTEVLLVDENGEMIIDGIVEDISPLRHRLASLEGRIEELEKANADLRDFAVLVSHELQEPLRMMERYTQLLQEEYSGRLGEDADEFIGFAVEGARTMSHIIDDLLQLTRVGGEQRTFHACDCDSLLDRAIRSLWQQIEESGARIHRQPLPGVLGDGGQLVQLFRNLIGNALKFRGDESPEIWIGVERRGDDWRFSVADNGIGVPEEQRQRVFEIFRRLHPQYEGSGVGLALCQRIVERHGGRIWIDTDREARGTTVTFTLPRQPESTTRDSDEGPVTVGQQDE